MIVWVRKMEIDGVLVKMRRAIKAWEYERAHIILDSIERRFKHEPDVLWLTKRARRRVG